MIGKRFSHYEIVEKIGAGGMGEVYRARDSHLDRDVAIKILPESFAGDIERLARFEREAKLLASLNHPNIGTIHGFEEANSVRFLVLELVEGEDLSERIARGPLPMNEALEIARQLAAALEEAHARGVVHRDLKPANIKITVNGQVKVLDFGLAKALAPDADDASQLSQSPTIMSGATQHGVILGTAAYMSPEQARGKATDHRTDIWAFGCVFYEMLTGAACFTGETITDILTGIIHREPDLNKLPRVAPGVRRVIQRCLRKDPHNRMQHIGDVRIEIDDALAGTEEDATVTPAPGRKRGWMAWAIGGLLGAALGAIAMMILSPAGTEAPPSPHVRFAVTPPIGTTALANPTLSPNARWLAYTSNDGMIIHDLERDEPRLLPALNVASRMVMFSPDSDWIGFNAGGKMQKVRVSGGVPVDLVNVGDHPGQAWGSRHTIVYAPNWTSGLFEISDEGGEPKQVTVVNREQGETGHWSPSFLPDGRHVLFTVFTTQGSLKHSRMELLDLETGERVPLGVGAYPVYLSGSIIYHRSGLYEMAPFDLATKKFTAAPRVVLEHVPYVEPSGNSARFFSVSENNVLAYIDVDDYPDTGPRSLAWLGRDGRREPLQLPPNQYGAFKVSPDGKRLATTVYEAGENDIWVYDLDRGTGRRVTRESNNMAPIWNADNQRVAFISTRLGTFDAFVVNVDSGEPPVPLFPADQDVVPFGWTPDGALLASITTADQSDNIIRIVDGVASEFLATNANEGTARISTDGEWVAYVSNRTGRTEIYVQGLNGLGNPVQISTAGGDTPLWSRKGNTLYFENGPTVGEIMMVTYQIRDGRFEANRPMPYLQNDDGTVGPDGTRRVAASDLWGSYAISDDDRLIVSFYETNPKPRVHVALDALGELERQSPSARYE